MKKYQFKIFFIAITLLSFNCSVKPETGIPDSVVLKADEFIISKTGEDFFNNYIKLNPELSKNLDSAFYFSYSFVIPEKKFINEKITFFTDENGTIIKEREITGIPDCYSPEENCEFNIDEKNAEDIAINSGLEKGIKDWKTEFTWNARHKKYVWQITATLSESGSAERFRGTGKEMIIDAVNGNVIEVNEWKVR